MTLSAKLLHMRMTHHCASCGQAFNRKGSWFKAARRFRCKECQADTTIGYDDKLRLFSKYRGVMKSQGGIAPNGEAGMKEDKSGEPETSSPDGVTKEAAPVAQSAAVLDGDADGKGEPGNGPDDKPIKREDVDFVPVRRRTGRSA
jgi:DNA-directed RNA polymerase subunit RPC12/RpoP